MRTHLLLVTAALTASALAAHAAPGHPRIFITAGDLPRLRALASDTDENSLGRHTAEGVLVR
ncbi:MAG TPA: hypothetical protein DEP45_03980, partial [Armatimonadetes bacterium]|nr:hypothetical protein [Armatimonadota bacterium]